MQTVVLGLGNELLGDEGVGIHAVRSLQQEDLPAEILLVEVGTAILDALPCLENAERIIVIDAMKEGQAPGTIYRIPLENCSGSTCIASMHGFDIFRTMALIARPDTPPVLVFGVEPENIGWSMELSKSVAGALPHLLEAVKTALVK